MHIDLRDVEKETSSCTCERRNLCMHRGDLRPGESSKVIYLLGMFGSIKLDNLASDQSLNH